MNSYIVTLQVDLDGDTPQEAAEYLREYVKQEKHIFVQVEDDAGNMEEVEI